MEMQLKHLVLAHHPVLLKKKKREREREKEKQKEKENHQQSQPWCPGLLDPPASAFRVAATTGV
jgi:hypothetical protein